MRRVSAALFLLPALAAAQSTQPPLRFEVCDIQPSRITDPRQMRADFLPGGRVDVRGISMKEIVAAVYKVGDDLVRGPAWMASERYDIVAKAAPTSTEDQLFEMAKTMLAERFKMVWHMEKKEAAVYALVAGRKGVKMKESTTPREGAGTFHDVICPLAPPVAGQTDLPGTIHRECHAVSMSDLAIMIPQIAPAYFQGLPVVDLTELKGAFDFKLDWMGRNYYNAAVASASTGAPADDRVMSIFDAVERLGLRLENRKYPRDLIVVDSIERTPTDQ